MRRVALLLAGLIALTFMRVEAQADNVQVTIDPSQEVGEISPYVYGLGHGPWSGVSLQMREEAAETGTTFLRWPGGNWGDLNNITRPQIDLYVAEARGWNAEPSIHVRLENGTPDQAAEIVRYTNIEKGYNIRYWAIGNEPTLFDDYDVTRFSNEWREIAIAMEAVDPTILLIGPEVHQYADSYEPSYLDDMRAWVRGFLEINGDMVDIVSIHRYPFPLSMDGTLTTIAQMRENVPRWETLVEILRADIHDTLGRDLPIAITEVNSHWNNIAFSDTSPDSYYNAIWWSGTLSTLIRERVDIVAYFLLSNPQALGSFGILDRYNPRPTYYTYQLFRDFGSMQLVSESSDDYVTVVAARREDGAITLIITNLYEEARSVTLDLGGTAISEVNEMRVLAPELLAETVDPAAYFDGTVLEMPAQSAIRLVITVDS
jgi:hypothetical protein